MTILDDPEDRVDLRSQTMEEENRKHKRKGKGEGEEKKRRTVLTYDSWWSRS